MTSLPSASPLQTRRLPGGLPLVIQHRPGPAILAARLVARGGSARDPQGQRGAHQLLAGLMTRGCGDLDALALADLVEGAGAALRAEANEDALVLGLKCAREDAPTLLPLLIAMVRRPCLDPDQLALERQLNLQSLQRQREDPFQLAYDGLRRLLHDGGPYGHDPLGHEADLPGIGVENLMPLQERLGDEGAVMVVCGDLPDGVLALLEEALGRDPWSTSAPELLGFDPWQPPSERLVALEQDTEQLVLMLGAGTVPLAHSDALALRLLQAHLGQGMSSRLFHVMREERGLAYDVGVHLPARCRPAPFVLHLSTSSDRAEEATAALLQEWRRIQDVPLTEEELSLARAKFVGQDAMARQTCAQIAERQALILSHGLPADHVQRILLRSATTTSEQLRDAARRWLGSPCISLVGPPEALARATAVWSGHPAGAGAGERSVTSALGRT